MITIREIRPTDNAAVAAIIQSVMPEFGASLPGFAIHDPEVANMFSAYQKTRAGYFVIEINGKIAGGGGIDQLKGGAEDICELQKMYFLPEARGKGLGQQLLLRCLDAARAYGYRFCYLETFHKMKDAIRLYEKNGFQRIEGPMGATGHFACDTFFSREL